MEIKLPQGVTRGQFVQKPESDLKKAKLKGLEALGAGRLLPKTNRIPPGELVAAANEQRTVCVRVPEYTKKVNLMLGKPADVPNAMPGQQEAMANANAEDRVGYENVGQRTTPSLIREDTNKVLCMMNKPPAIHPYTNSEFDLNFGVEQLYTLDEFNVSGISYEARKKSMVEITGDYPIDAKRCKDAAILLLEKICLDTSSQESYNAYLSLYNLANQIRKLKHLIRIYLQKSEGYQKSLAEALKAYKEGVLYLSSKVYILYLAKKHAGPVMTKAAYQKEFGCLMYTVLCLDPLDTNPDFKECHPALKEALTPGLMQFKAKWESYSKYVDSIAEDLKRSNFNNEWTHQAIQMNFQTKPTATMTNRAPAQPSSGLAAQQRGR
jgi:hypothetical protein